MDLSDSLHRPDQLRKSDQMRRSIPMNKAINPANVIDLSDPVRVLNAFISSLHSLSQQLRPFYVFPSSHLLCTRMSLQITLLNNQLLRWKERGLSCIPEKELDLIMRHFTESYKGIVRNVQQVLEIGNHSERQSDPQLREKVRNAKDKKIKKKMELLKEVQRQMGEQWEEDQIQIQTKNWSNKQIVKENLGLCRLNDVICLSEKVKSSDLASLAKQHLHQQFLAIRIISYRMYENYTSHSHSALLQRLQSLRMEQSRLEREINEGKQNAKWLKDEGKRLEKEVAEIRRVNDMVGGRYFVTEDQVGKPY